MPLHGAGEHDRLFRLLQMEILDTEPESAFDHLARFAAELFQCPLAGVSLVDADRIWFKSSYGTSCGEVPREGAFCDRVIEENSALVVPDARQDTRFAQSAFVTPADGLRFYAGAPIMLDDVAIGTVCVLDTTPRNTTAAQLEQLGRLAELASHMIRNRRFRQETEAISHLFSASPIVLLAWAAKPGWPVTEASANIRRLIGPVPEEVLSTGFWFERLVHPADRGALRQVLASHGGDHVGMHELDYRLVDPQGREVWVRQLSYPEFAGDGSLRKIRGYLIDQTERKALELQLRIAKERATLALDSAALGTWDCHIPSRQLVLSPRCLTTLGMGMDEAEQSTVAWLNRVHALDRPKVEALFRDHLDGRSGHFESEHRVRHGNGEWLWVHSYGRVVERDAGGAAVRVVGIGQDITSRKRAEERQELQREMLDLINQAQRCFLLERDMRGACNLLFHPLIDLTGSQSGFIGEVLQEADGKPLLRIHAISDISWNATSRALMRKHEEHSLEFRNLDNLFGRVITEVRTIVANDPATHPLSRGLPKWHPVLDSFLGLPITFNGEVIGMIGLANRLGGYDDTVIELLHPMTTTLGLLIHARRLEQAREQAVAEQAKLATHDELTNLLNRRAFLELATRELADVRRTGRSIWLCLLDLDHFKRINDRFGHAGGDAVLREFARVINGLVRETDLFGRIGGEEFAVLLRDVTPGDIVPTLDRIRGVVEAIRVPFNGAEIRFTVSIGATPLTAGYSSIEDALIPADDALYTAKRNGRNSIRLGAVPSEATSAA